MPNVHYYFNDKVLDFKQKSLLSLVSMVMLAVKRDIVVKNS